MNILKRKWKNQDNLHSKKLKKQKIRILNKKIADTSKPNYQYFHQSIKEREKEMKIDEQNSSNTNRNK